MAEADQSYATTIVMGVVEPDSEKRGNSCDTLSAARESSLTKPSSRVLSMNVLSARIDRFLIAAALGLIVASVGSLMIEQAPSAAIARGDFPAFYTMATLASRGEGARLYDLATQRQLQNEVWPSLDGSVLPVAYPAFLALFVESLATLSPSTARLVWILSMALCVVIAGAFLVRSSSFMRGMTWQVVVALLLFGPLFLGVLGGQIVGVSVLLYAAILFLDRKKKKGLETPLGVVTGLWMYKPHFALAIVVVFLLQRRWRAIVAWLITSGALWALGASIAGVGWLSEWVVFAKGFAYIDLVSNAPRMTGVVPFLFVLSGSVSGGWRDHVEVWQVFTLIASLTVPCALAFVVRRGGPIMVSPGLLAVGPLLVLLAPAVNFYDLAISAVPLLLMVRPTLRGDLWMAGGVIVLSHLVMLLKDAGVAGVCLLYGAVLGLLLRAAIARERKEIASAH
ncbi:MAG: hypothetical protein RIS36_396 [Pseudomonadota bacterium]|jgi:hypothetical protein